VELEGDARRAAGGGMSGELYTLDELDEILREDGRSGYVGVSAIDGLIAALVAGPVVVAPETWLPLIFAGKIPDAPEGTSVRRVVDTVLAHQTSVETTLALRPRSYSPIFMHHLGAMIVEDWVIGFMMGFSIAPDAWMPILLSPTRLKLKPIFAAHELGQGFLPDVSKSELSSIQATAHHNIPAATVEGMSRPMLK
jgi:yecA family protein